MLTWKITPQSREKNSRTEPVSSAKLIFYDKVIPINLGFRQLHPE